MPTPYRIPSPPEPDERDAEEPYAVLLRAQQRRGRVAASILACVTGAAVIASVARPAPAQPAVGHLAKREEARRARAHDAIASARRHAAEAQHRFASEIRAAVRAGVAPREELGACPLPLETRTGVARGPAFPLVIVNRADVEAREVPSQAIADVLADVRRAEAHHAGGRHEEAALYAEALEHPGRLVLDVVLVETESTKPEVTSHGSFVPGEVVGRAYLYDFGVQRVVCAADVRAKSSSAIGYAYAIGPDAPVASGRSPRLKDAIDRDLREQIERAVAEGIRYRASAP